MSVPGSTAPDAQQCSRSAAGTTRRPLANTLEACQRYADRLSSTGPQQLEQSPMSNQVKSDGLPGPPLSSPSKDGLDKRDGSVLGKTSSDSSMKSDDSHKLTLLQAIGLNTMNMFGTGPLITIPYCLASVNPEGPQCLIGYSLATVACMMDSLVWAELGSLWPKTGGSYIYLRELYGGERWGRFMAFIFVWQFIISGPAEIAAGYISIVEYAAFFFPHGIDYWTRVVASLSLTVITVMLLFRKPSEAGFIGLVMWGVTIIVILYTCIIGFSSWDVDNMEQVPTPNAPQVVWSIAAASRFGIFDMTGYYNVNSMGDEVKNPRRTIPLAGIVTTYVVGTFFLLIYAAVIGMQPFQDYIYMFRSDYTDAPHGIMSIVTQNRFGSVTLTSIVTIFTLITIFGSTFAQMCSYSYIPFAAARDGYFLSFLGHMSERHEGLADRSLLLIGAISCIWCFFTIDQVVDAMTTLLVLVQFVGQSVGLLWYRYKNPNAGGWRMPFYPWPCIIQIFLFMFVFCTSRSRLLYGSEEPTLELALGILFGGLVIFLLRSWHLCQWPFEAEIQTTAKGQLQIAAKGQQPASDDGGQPWPQTQTEGENSDLDRLKDEMPTTRVRGRACFSPRASKKCPVPWLAWLLGLRDPVAQNFSGAVPGS